MTHKKLLHMDYWMFDIFYFPSVIEEHTMDRTVPPKPIPPLTTNWMYHEVHVHTTEQSVLHSDFGYYSM